MLKSPVRIIAALFVVCGALAFLTNAPRRADAQRATGIDTYAITNARIVTVSGPVIARGTLVVRDGLIAAVGERVTAPPDARTIDGTGLTVYPGLIDANTTLAIPRPTPPPAGPPGPLAFLFGPQTPPSATSPNSTQLPGLQPEIMASDIIRPGGPEIEAARSAGLTAAQTAPRGPIFPGQSAIINLAGDTPQQMLVRSPVALHVGFTPLGSGQYPGSLMGVFASIRQLLLDAQRYREANEIYSRSPRGLRRPEQDKSLQALLPVLARQMPLVVQADREREISRALDLAQEFGVQVVIAGGAESDRVAARLKAMNVPVLLSLNFPRRTTAPSPEADPDPVRVLRERVEAPKTAGRLAAAGVRFAFQSGGMTTMTDFLANAARAVENGLSRDDAVRAMTLRAAEILGVSDRLGSIEVGKIANLTVTRGDLFDKTRQIAHVFIDGRPVDLRPATAAAPGAPGASGTWTVTVNLGGVGGQAEQTITLNLQQQGDRLTGSMQGPLGSGQIGAGSVTGSDIRFTVPITLPAPASQTTDAMFVGTITGNEMRGTVQVVGRGTGTFSGTRPGGAPTAAPPPTGAPGTTPPPSAAPAAATDITGTWTLEISIAGRSIPATLSLQQQGANFSGTMQSEFGSSQITGSVGGSDFRFSCSVTISGQNVDVNFAGTASGGQMSGTVTTPQGAGSFTGSRTP